MTTDTTQETVLNPVQEVTIKDKITLYRDGEPALGIELIVLEEFGYSLVSQKDLYKIGDKAIYIMPDHSLSNISLFESFTAPGGDPKKSRLGSRNRIRAIKFNKFNTADSTDTIFSDGILLPKQEVLDYMKANNLVGTEYAEALQITKWEEQEPNSGGLNLGANKKTFPKGMYKTDETNINNLWGHLENKIGYPVTLVGTEKIDGSSITIYRKDFVGGVCSRNLEKAVYYNKVVGRRKKTFLERLMFWKKDFDLNIYKEVFNDDDDFITYGYPYATLMEVNGINDVALRGELNGSHLKGSGNKNNPSRLEKPNIKFFGADFWNPNEREYTKMPYTEFMQIVKDLDLKTCKEVFNQTFNSREEITKACNEYFKTNQIEGIVLRTLDSNFSAKFMNLEYDSKK